LRGPRGVPLFGLGSFEGGKKGGGTARQHPFNIFESAVFRVALRIGTKFEGADVDEV
jgi:hypothetical protein